ncbi:MAG: DUF885 domain-containing protein [Chthoniobacterales bacterium]
MTRGLAKVPGPGQLGRLMPARFLLALVTALALLPHAFAAEPTEDEKFQALIAKIWAWDMHEFPEWATSLGKREGLDRWTDESREAIERRDAKTREFLADLEKINAKQLTAKWRGDYDLLLHDYKEGVEGQKFPGELLALNQLGGVHDEISNLMQQVPAERAEDFDAILARYNAVPKLVDQNIELLKRGLAAGITVPRVTLATVPAQLDAIINDESSKNPILAPFEKNPPLLAKEKMEQYRAQAMKAFRETVLPALQKYRAFVNETYIPGARESIGMSAMPGGTEWYAFDAKSSTTTDLTPKQIHEIGEKEVARIEEEMTALREKIGFKGDKAAFGKFLRSDPKFYYRTPDEILAAYRNICKSTDPELPHFFGKLPRLTYGVKPVPDYAADAKPTAYYEPGSPAAGRAGYFFANTSHLDQRPSWEMEALALHESVPGHHLQIALAQEMDEKPELLRERGYTAFIEGWALYCEGLGKEMGLYKDPYSDYGRLTYEMWRAVRLVVDTGIHSQGWTRQQAIDYFREHAALSDHNIKVEVDRYIVWPGQALAYKIGQMKITELRRRAEKALGDKFDIRKFHDVVLGDGAVPLDVLEKHVDAWIAAQKTK